MHLCVLLGHICAHPSGDTPRRLPLPVFSSNCTHLQQRAVLTFSMAPWLLQTKRLSADSGLALATASRKLPNSLGYLLCSGLGTQDTCTTSAQDAALSPYTARPEVLL